MLSQGQLNHRTLPSTSHHPCHHFLPSSHHLHKWHPQAGPIHRPRRNTPPAPLTQAAYTDSPQYGGSPIGERDPRLPYGGAPPAALGISEYRGGLATLVTEINAAEERLQAMFQPGQIMPKASVVNKLRASIAEMQGQLRELVAETEAQQRQGTRAATSAEREALSKAKLIVLGVPLSSSTVGAGTAQQGSAGYEMAYLQAENEQLRKQAQMLLVRQKLLEEIADELGIKRRRRS